MRDDRCLIRLALVSDAGLARFRPVMNRADVLKGVEVMACMPHEGLTRTQVRALISAVIEAAVWRSPSFQAVARGLPVPPEFPDGRDPSLGINKGPNTFSSPGGRGVQFIFGDSSVRFINNDIDPKVLKALATPNGGEVIEERF